MDNKCQHLIRMNHIERKLVWKDVAFGMDTFRQHAPCNYLIIVTDLYGNKFSEYPSTWNYFWTQKLKYGV